jgi:ArsR family transcriptional regulator
MAARRTRREGADGRIEPDPAREPDAAVRAAASAKGEEGPTRASQDARLDTAIRESANVFSLLSDETRLRILVYLMQNGELNVTELGKRLEQHQPAVSHQLALMRVAGIIEPRRSGKNQFYRVQIDHFSDLLARLLSASGRMPKKIRFHGFTLSHQGR